MPEQPTFTVIACLRRYAWGATCRLRLDSDVTRQDLRFGSDTLGGPMIRDHGFSKPAGWEIDVTLTIPGISIGDQIAVDEVIAKAHLRTGDGDLRPR